MSFVGTRPEATKYGIIYIHTSFGVEEYMSSNSRNGKLTKYKKLITDTLIFALGNLGSKVILFFMVPLYTNKEKTRFKIVIHKICNKL